MPLTGTLQDLSLANLVQLQCNEQQHAQVTLTRGKRKGTLTFANGDLIAARVDDQTGEDAVYELLTWEDGNFNVSNENVPTERNVTTPWSALLLEGLRRADEVRVERDTALEKRLRELVGKQNLRDALVTNRSGMLCADAKAQNSLQDAALVAFVAERGETLGAILELGAFAGLTATTPNEKIIVEKMGSNYLGCWLEPRATPDQIKSLLTAIGITR